MILSTTYTVGEAGILAVTGYAVVFVGILLLLGVLLLTGRYFAGKKEQPAAAAPAPVAPAAPAAPAAPKAAPGSAGKLKIYDVEPATAAMLMAMVADKTGKPLNELRFISIKEVK